MRIGSNTTLVQKGGGGNLQRFRFLHTADLHIGTPFQGMYKHLPGDWMERLQRASYEVFTRIVDAAVREGVDFVTIAGDLYDQNTAPMSVHFELLRGFERLAEHNIPVFVIHGNHDPLTDPSPVRWPNNVHVFPPLPRVVDPSYRAPSTLCTIGSSTTVQISGFSYLEPELYGSLAHAFHRDDQADFAIALYHGSVGVRGEHANYAAAQAEELIRRRFDFWGLGHIHKPAVIRESGPAILYPGNPQGRHVREGGVRGCVLVDVIEDKSVKLKFIPTSQVVWDTKTVDVTGLEELAELRSRLLKAVAEQLDRYAGYPQLIRLAVTGRTALHSAIDEGQWQQALNEEAAQRNWPAAIEKLELATGPAADLETLAHSREFIGELLRLTNDYKSDPAKARALLTCLKDVYHAGNDLALEAMTDEDVFKLLDEALSEVLKSMGQEVEWG